MPDARATYREGFDHFANDRIDAAIECFRRAVELDASLALAWNALAMALERAEDFDGAIDAIKTYIELDPDDALGHTSLSIFYQRKGLIQEAEDEMAIATRLSAQQQSGS